MKFDSLYPNQSTEIRQQGVVFEGSELIKSWGKPKPCWNCGELTLWVDTSFGAHLCSEECERQKWKEYWEDTRRS